jgi:hypothetical protein
MKKFYYTAFLFFLTTISFAQGISVQGIARDNTSSAITDENLTFTFSIVEDDNTVLYSETQGIKTDNFGVFSHIVNSGNPTVNTFNDVDFSIQNLKLKVSVVYDGNSIEVYDQPFQYTPYAHYAARATDATNAVNGVPTGSIMPYAGDTAPVGWVLCNGQSLTAIDGSTALRAIVGNNAPNLQGTYLRGTGTSPTNGRPGPALRGVQSDANKAHLHSVNIWSGYTDVSHRHRNSLGDGGNGTSTFAPNFSDTNTGTYRASYTDNTSINHRHAVNGDTGTTGNSETRVVGYGVNYIIKL